MKNVRRVGEITFKVLGLIGAGGLVMGAIIAPGLLIGLSVFLAKETGLPKRQVYERLWRAQRSGWLKIVETSEGLAVELTESGQNHLRLLSLDKPLHQDHWDKKWRIAIFDIPNKKKVSRDLLRRTLKNLGFIQLQESVWVTPYECQTQIKALRELYGLGPNLKLITAGEIDGEAELRAKFNLKS